METTRKLGWAVMLPALVVPMLGSLVYFVWMPEGVVGKTAYTLTKLFLLTYPLFFVLWTGWGGLFKRREGTTVSWKTIAVTGVISGVVISLAGAGLMLTPFGELVRAGAENVGERAEGLGFREHYLWVALYMSVIHSVMEEYYWRWFVYGNLQRLCGRWTAHIIAGVGFAAHHLVVTMQFFSPGVALFLSLCVAIGGVIWTVMVARQGTVVGSWISHLCVDVLLMWVGYELLRSG